MPKSPSTRDKSGGISSSTTFKYALEEQSEMNYTKMLTNLRKEINLYVLIYYKKMSLPKLSKRTIQDSIHQLMQTFRINRCIESQTGN